MPKKELLKYEDFDPETIGKIESPFFLHSIMLKDLMWKAKLNVRSILPRSYHRYKVIMSLDEQPWIDRISDFEKELDESLFKDERSSKKDVSRRVAEQKAALEKTKKECEKIEFSAVVDSLKYKDNATSIEIRIPDDVIEALNRQKVRIPIYKICLIPIF